MTTEARHGRRGATSVLYTLLLFILVFPILGLAIDATMLYIVQSQLQTAVDGAASGALRLLQTPANTTEIAGEFLRANFPTHFWSSAAAAPTNISVTTTTSAKTINVSATATVPLMFLRFLHQNTAMVAANASATAWTLTPCTMNYPTGTAPALSSVAFNESTVLVAFGPAFVYPHGRLIAWYSDEHALLLGIREVVVSSGGSGAGSGSLVGSGSLAGSGSTTTTGTTGGTSTTTDYSFTNYTAGMSAVNPTGPLAVGATALSGDQAGTDVATWNSQYGYLDHGRPFWPSLYITDITTDGSNTAGDWQQGSLSPIGPNAVYGTWKSAVRNVDTSTTPSTITITVDNDPTANNWTGIPDTPPGGFPSTEGYTAEIVWNLDSVGLLPGHTYRLQFMIHDGDQHSTGGDIGEGCAIASY